jgi:signal peptidase II
MPSDGERLRTFWGVMIVVVVLDRITKLLASHSLADRVIPVIGTTVQFRLVYNQAAAFGLSLGPWQRWLFVCIALAAVVWLYRATRQTPLADRLRRYAFGLVAAGAVGNVIDRLMSARGVVDFIDIGAGSLRWPTFNVADTAVTCGAVALAISLWREDTRRTPAASTST